MAVEHSEPNPDVIALLIAAGSDPFQPDRIGQNLKDTPFGRSFVSYETGENPFVLEQFLATGKLDPTSVLANLYLVHSTRYLRVMDRLLKYGITPKPSDDLIGNMSLIGTTPEDERRRIGMIDRLQRKYPFTKDQMRGQQGYQALQRVVEACRLRLAMYLLDHGAPASDKASNGGVLDKFLGSCDPPEEIPKEVGKPARQAFLGKVKRFRYDVNVMRAGDCPAWLYRDGPCGFPENDDVLSALLEMGAQPFRLTSHPNSNVFMAVIEGCRQRALNMILAKSPTRLEQQARIAVEQGIGLIGRQLDDRTSRCSRDFYLKNSAKLKALLASAG